MRFKRLRSRSEERKREMLVGVRVRDFERGRMVGRESRAVRWQVSGKMGEVVLVGEAWLCCCDAPRFVGGMGREEKGGVRVVLCARVNGWVQRSTCRYLHSVLPSFQPYRCMCAPVATLYSILMRSIR